MRSRARLFGHPLHQMLVVFPLGLLAGAVFFDIAFLITDIPSLATASYWMIAGGLIGAVLAVIPGYIDWLAIPEKTRAKRIGTLHGIGNLVVAALFLFSWILRDTDELPTLAAMVWSFAGAALALVTAWLGGELVDRLGVGVEDDAHLNAPNSLKVERERRRAAHGKGPIHG